jgi:hypothetical protein
VGPVTRAAASAFSPARSSAHDRQPLVASTHARAQTVAIDLAVPDLIRRLYHASTTKVDAEHDARLRSSR